MELGLLDMSSKLLKKYESIQVSRKVDGLSEFSRDLERG